MKDVLLTVFFCMFAAVALIFTIPKLQLIMDELQSVLHLTIIFVLMVVLKVLLDIKRQQK